MVFDRYTSNALLVLNDRATDIIAVLWWEMIIHKNKFKIFF